MTDYQNSAASPEQRKCRHLRTIHDFRAGIVRCEVCLSVLRKCAAPPEPRPQPTAMTIGVDLASGPDETVEYIIQNIESADDDLLAVFGALAAHGRIRIIPQADCVFQERLIPILSLPQKMHNRLIKLGREYSE